MLIINREEDYEQIEKNFEKASIITIEGKKYAELVNAVYAIQYDSRVLKEKIKCNKFDDRVERLDLIKGLDKCIDVLKNDMNSRRAVFTNLYDNGLGKCISLVHLFCRDGKAYINQYYRSQEFNKNFAYDFQTAIILMKKAMNELNVKPGLIIVFVANLHKEIE